MSIQPTNEPGAQATGQNPLQATGRRGSSSLTSDVRRKRAAEETLIELLDSRCLPYISEFDMRLLAACEFGYDPDKAPTRVPPEQANHPPAPPEAPGGYLRLPRHRARPGATQPLDPTPFPVLYAGGAEND
jgi:hypothetical protein